MVPELPAAMIAKARSWMLERSMGSRSTRLPSPILDDYRACLDGLKAIELYVSEDHSEAEVQRIVDEILMRYYQQDRYHELAAELSTQLPSS